MLSIQLLGGFKITDDGQPLPSLTRPRGKSLLAYLLLHHATPQDRGQLAYTFWPETSDRQARTNLRRELHQLRQAFPLFDALIQSDGSTVQWQMHPADALDVTEFTRLLAAAAHTTDSGTRKAWYQAAIDLYHGDLLPGLYDDWVLTKREELRQGYIQALETLTALLVTEREYIPAITLTQRLLHYDPLYEAGYVQLMELYALQKDRARALYIYHTCATVLERELGVPPGEEIATIYQRLLHAEGRAETVPAVTTTATQLVGRKAEWQTVLATWRQASQGRAHLLLIAGEAGIGKTRLGEELLEWVNRQGIGTARTRSYAAEGALAYAPVIEWLRAPAMRPAITGLEPVWRTEVVRLLPELLLEFPDLPRPEPLTERWQRQRLFEALARAFTHDQTPKLLLIDDLQWCDGETLAWLRYLLRFTRSNRQSLRAAPLLIVGTARGEEVDANHPLTTLLLHLQQSDEVTEVTLAPLSAIETAELAAQLTATPLSADTVQAIYSQSEGSPLFVVEMMRAGMNEWEAKSTTAVTTLPSAGSGLPLLPPKVHAVIQQRLNQLTPAARQLLGPAATIGRSFTLTLLAAASETLTEADLVQILDELWQRGLVRTQEGNVYDFSHDRIRDVAYAELSPVQRPLLHKRVALALEAHYRQDFDAVSAQLAAHYEQAGLATQAILFYHRAAVVEAQVLAHANAVT